MAFHELMALFQPGLKHTVEEQERKRNEVVLPGDAAGGWDVDLDAGTATLAASADATSPAEAEPGADQGAARDATDPR